MKTFRHRKTVLFLFALASALPLCAQPRVISDLLLVNGATTRVEVLFKHPNAELLILRSESGSTSNG